MSIIEILDANGIDSYNMLSFIKECQKFRSWYCKIGTQKINEVEMAKAYLKIDYKIKVYGKY